MQSGLIIVGLIVLVLVGVAAVWRWSDHRDDAAERLRLLADQPVNPSRFDASMIAGLPEVARRYFTFTIAEGTPLYTVADIFMTGQFSMGTKDKPDYLDMSAEQTLAAPGGFVWKMSAKQGLMHISGSDSGRWTRFWLMGLGPVARMGGDPDHKRSAFGRFIAEAVFWTPAALLPGPGIEWQAVNDITAKVSVTSGELSQEVEITVDDEGRPVSIQFLRWSSANSEKIFRLQCFGGFLSEFRSFSGFSLPTHIEAGNHFGTPDYFPFFIADVSNIQFPVDGSETTNK